jgi:hypothetical protein
MDDLRAYSDGRFGRHRLAGEVEVRCASEVQRAAQRGRLCQADMGPVMVRWLQHGGAVRRPFAMAVNANLLL